MKRILVLGHRGFIGSHLFQYLSEKSYDVISLPESELNRSYEHSIKNALSSLDGQRVDIVVNCAGSGNVGLSYDTPDEDFKKNVSIVSEILDYAKNQPHAPRIIQLSSAAVYGCQPLHMLKEEMIPAPVSPYGNHKKMSEELCEYHHEVFGTDVTVIRFFSIYGNGLRKQLLWDACNKFSGDSSQDAIFFGTGQETRDFLHIDDAVRLIERCFEGEAGYRLLNGGSGRSTTIRELLEELAIHFDQRFSFNNEAKQGDPKHYWADISKTTSVLGWTPAVELSVGVQAYTTWFKEVR